MKAGANNPDINKIKRLYALGMTSEEISGKLQIVESCVVSFAPEEEEIDISEDED